MTASRHRDYHALLTVAAFVACCGATRIVGTQGPAAAVPSARGTSDPVVELRAGKNYIATEVYSEEEDRRVIELFRGLRVADLADGMDKAGLQSIGLVSPEIKPLWRDTKKFTHRIVGVAVTAGRFRSLEEACGAASHGRDIGVTGPTAWFRMRPPPPCRT